MFGHLSWSGVSRLDVPTWRGEFADARTDCYPWEAAATNSKFHFYSVTNAWLQVL